MIFKHSSARSSRYRSTYLRRAAARKRTYEQASKEKKEARGSSSKENATADSTGHSTVPATK